MSPELLDELQRCRREFQVLVEARQMGIDLDNVPSRYQERIEAISNLLEGKPAKQALFVDRPAILGQ